MITMDFNLKTRDDTEHLGNPYLKPHGTHPSKSSRKTAAAVYAGRGTRSAFIDSIRIK